MSTTPALGNTTSTSFPPQQIEKVTKNFKERFLKECIKLSELVSRRKTALNFNLKNYSSRFEVFPLETEASTEDKANNPTHFANNYQNQTQSLNTLHEEELFP